MVRSPLPTLMALCLALGGSAGAAQEVQAPWTFAGFGTLGAARSSTSDAQYLRDLTQKQGVDGATTLRLDSRLGLQVTGPLSDTLRFTAQVVGKYDYTGEFKPDLTWGLLAWTPTPEVQIRTGRLGWDVFMDADSRDVGYSYLWVRPPVEFFGGLPVSHLDGLDASRSFSLASGLTFRLKGYAGWASGKVPVGGDDPLNLNGSRLVGLLGEAASGSWRARLGYAQFRPRHDFPQGIADVRQGLRQFSLALGDPRLAASADLMVFDHKVFHYTSGAISYEEDHLQVQGAVARYRTDSVMSPDSWSGFVSLGYRLGPVVPYAVWSRVVSRHPALELGALPMVPLPQAQGLVQVVDAIMRASRNDQYTCTLGLRWNLAEKACLKAQVDYARAHDSSGLWTRLQPGWDGRATIASLALDFVF